VLVVDDERAMCELVVSALAPRGFELCWRTSAEEALELARREPFDVVLTDLRMPHVDGAELCRRIAEVRPDASVIVMTAFGSLESALSALRAGAYDMVTKPIEMDLLAYAIERAAEHSALAERVRSLSEALRGHDRFEGLVGESEEMQAVYAALERAAAAGATVLLTGESGTGKELAARALHARGERRAGPFVAVDCASLPEALVESELFGHAAGAYTGAQGARQGLFVQATGGTLFLDEVGELPLATQARLLRALETRRVRPVGAEAEQAFDARIVAATNRDLESAVAEGRFRADLFYRLDVLRIELPPLRARGADVLLLAQHFLQRAAAAHGKRVAALSPPAARRLAAYDWPGNVRELKNAVERAVVLTANGELALEDLPARVRDHEPDRLVLGAGEPDALETLEEVERRYLRHVLERLGWNRTRAARALGLDRKTLYRKLLRHGLRPERDEG
jgi:two-component system response regulator HydG